MRWISIALLAACGGSPKPVEPTPAVAPAPAAVAGSAMNAPEIAQSGGVAGGIVILWPRIPGHATDATARGIATELQKELERLANAAAPNVAIDTRPEPERACGRQGCEALAISAVLIVCDGGCAIAATIQKPGPSEVAIVPWSGEMRLKSPTVAFREAPEGSIAVHDYEPCDRILGSLGSRGGQIVDAIRAAR